MEIVLLDHKVKEKCKMIINNFLIITVVIPSEIVIPRSMSLAFKSLRMKFGITFYNIRRAIKNSLPLTGTEDLKMLLQDCFPDLRPQLINCKLLDDVLDVVRDKCTLIDITCLEAIVIQFNIKDAEVHIQAYKEIIEKFSQSVSVRLCLKEKFNVASSLSASLQCETVEFVLDWDPDDDYTLNDIKDVLSECFEKLSKTVQINVIKKVNSITVTCSFPLNFATLLIAKAQETIEVVKKRGLIWLRIGQCIIYDKKKR